MFDACFCLDGECCVRPVRVHRHGCHRFVYGHITVLVRDILGHVVYFAFGILEKAGEYPGDDVGDGRVRGGGR